MVVPNQLEITVIFEPLLVREPGSDSTIKTLDGFVRPSCTRVDARHVVERVLLPPVHLERVLCQLDRTLLLAQSGERARSVA